MNPKISYDSSHLPPADFEFVVVGDTHYILDPESYAIEFDSVRKWPQRVERALQHVSALKPEFVIHLGDLAEENPSKADYLQSRHQAKEQLARNGIAPYYVAGNMDIGDKPDATMWTDPVTHDSLQVYQKMFGDSWYSFDRHDIHFVILNSQIMNGTLEEADQQVRWLEADLEEHRDGRIIMFTHMPPFFVDEDEPDTGFYNSINEPARSWITKSLRRFEVEMLFTGHTHFRAYNRVGDTRFFICPSTTTSRAGFYEAFTVAPPVEQGRNDPEKLGFYLIRIYGQGSAVHFIRTNGETEVSAKDQVHTRWITRLSQDLPNSPLGVFLRTPLAFQTEGALAWPSVLRQRVRDDHPFLSCLELGVRHIRIPVSDLDEPLQKRRIQLLRSEGVQVTAIWIWTEGRSIPEGVREREHLFDTVEVQCPGALYPDISCLDQLQECVSSTDKSVVFTPIVAKEEMGGKYHPRTRFGYRAAELPVLNRHLLETRRTLDRVLCHVDSNLSPWETMSEIGRQLPMSEIGAVDYIVGACGKDDTENAYHCAEALLAAAIQPGCRVYLDPLVDLDRTNDVCHGLLDRLSNPRPCYAVAQALNTVLFSDSSTVWEPVECDLGIPEIQDTKSGRRLRLVTDIEARLLFEHAETESIASSRFINLANGTTIDCPTKDQSGSDGTFDSDTRYLAVSE
jgi:predicted phosphodiesterase